MICINPAISNQLLVALPDEARARWRPVLEPVVLQAGQVLYESGCRQSHVYFPCNAIVSLLYVTENGKSAEIAVVGREGVVGIALFMGGDTTADRAVVQSAGMAYRLTAQFIKTEFEQSRDVARLLLTTLEDFTTAEAAAILDRSPEDVAEMVAQAIADIEREQTTSVLIIEDEPLIAMQLEDLVSGLGHSICGTAATRSQAQEVVEQAMPGLVLADIQLADGSSGLDAVDDILSTGSMPVIFITAYPERLLTGDRPEPTYLVTKPFQEATVRAAISQALFFGSTRPLG